MDGIVDGGDGHGSLSVKVRNSATTMPTKLETVEEGSQPATPGNEISQMLRYVHHRLLLQYARMPELLCRRQHGYTLEKLQVYSMIFYPR